MLRVPLTTIPEGGLVIDETITESSIRPEGVESIGMQLFQVSGVLHPMEGQYLFRGFLEGSFNGPCVRCLGEAIQSVQFEVTWLFEEHAHCQTMEDVSHMESNEREDFVDVEDDYVFGITGDTIDLASRIWEEIVLAYPLRLLCNENCAGLCPQCGADLNREACRCTESRESKNTQSSFAVLSDLLSELTTDLRKENTSASPKEKNR